MSPPFVAVHLSWDLSLFVAAEFESLDEDDDGHHDPLRGPLLPQTYMRRGVIDLGSGDDESSDRIENHGGNVIRAKVRGESRRGWRTGGQITYAA